MKLKFKNKEVDFHGGADRVVHGSDLLVCNGKILKDVELVVTEEELLDMTHDELDQVFDDMLADYATSWNKDIKVDYILTNL